MKSFEYISKIVMKNIKNNFKNTCLISWDDIT